MNVILWVLQGLAALAFFGSGLGKLVQPKAKLASAPRMGWANDFSQEGIRLIGAAEVAGALGLVLPAALGILPWLTPLAALGLAAIMAGGFATHLRRSESGEGSLVLGVLSLAILVGRLWLAPL